MRLISVALGVLALAVAPGCSDGGADPPSEVTGTIVAVRGTEDVVTAVTVQGDERVELWIAEDVDDGFDLHHLREHQATGDPVRCTVEERDGRLYALSIADG